MVVVSNATSVTLNDLCLMTTNGQAESVFRVFGGMTLEVTGTNTLQSGVARAGIEVQSGATLEIGGGGVLEAFGGEEGAGIVGGTVRIVSGTMRVRADGPTSDFVTEKTRILGGSVLSVTATARRALWPTRRVRSIFGSLTASIS